MKHCKTHNKWPALLATTQQNDRKETEQFKWPTDDYRPEYGVTLMHWIAYSNSWSIQTTKQLWRWSQRWPTVHFMQLLYLDVATLEDLVEAPTNREPLKGALHLRADGDRQVPDRILMKEAFRLMMTVFRDARTSLTGADGIKCPPPFSNSDYSFILGQKVNLATADRSTASSQIIVTPSLALPSLVWCFSKFQFARPCMVYGELLVVLDNHHWMIRLCRPTAWLLHV